MFRGFLRLSSPAEAFGLKLTPARRSHSACLRRTASGTTRLDVSLEADAAQSEPDFTDLGSPDYATFDDVLLEADARFEVTTARAGLWTLEAAKTAAAFSVLDADGRVLARSSSGRVDLTVEANETLTVVSRGATIRTDLTVTNLVQVDGEQVSVFGTTRSGHLRFRSRDRVHRHRQRYGVLVRRIRQRIPVRRPRRQGHRHFDRIGGLGGCDPIRFRGRTPWRDLSDNHLETRRSTRSTPAEGTTASRCSIPAGNDSLTTTPDEATLVGPGIRESGPSVFRAVHGLCNGGGESIRRSSTVPPETTTLTASPQQVKLVGTTFYTRVKYFDSVTAYAEGGNDSARFTDSAGDDRLTASPGGGSVFRRRFRQRSRRISIRLRGRHIRRRRRGEVDRIGGRRCAAGHARLRQARGERLLPVRQRLRYARRRERRGRRFGRTVRFRRRRHV